MASLAPIVLFVYNRPWHTEQTLNALKANDLADQSVLYIYADGPKKDATPEQLEKIKEVRKLIRKEKWCREVHIIESESNKGLADSIVAGVTEVVNRHGKIIVLEDDIVTSRGFLKYMNDALDMYENEEKVMHISGYMFPVKGNLPETFFYKQTSCWGWGTWANRWVFLERDIQKLFHEAAKLERDVYDLDGTNQFWKQLIENLEQRKRTWAVFWQFSVLLNHGLCLHPGKSLVSNIGLDGTGENCGNTKMFNSAFVETVRVKKIPVVDNKRVYKQLRLFYSIGNGNKKALSRIGRVKRLIPSSLKYRIKLLLNRDFRDYEEEKKRIANLPRYVETDINFLDKKLRITDIASFNFLKQEIFDQQIYNFRSERTDPLIIDCGANIGMSVIYFKTIYPDARIIAFEADKHIFEVLKSNIEKYELTNVELVNKACWNSETTLRFFSEGADGGRMAEESETEKIITVDTIRLKRYLKEKIDFLKIDIEGAEIEVLPDIQNELKNVENIFVEYHSFVGKQQRLPEILEILKNAGFRFHLITVGVCASQPYLFRPEYASMDNQINIFGWRVHEN